VLRVRKSNSSRNSSDAKDRSLSNLGRGESESSKLRGRVSTNVLAVVSGIASGLSLGGNSSGKSSGADRDGSVRAVDQVGIISDEVDVVDVSNGESQSRSISGRRQVGSSVGSVGERSGNDSGVRLNAGGSR